MVRLHEIRLNPFASTVRFDAKDPYMLHRELLKAFDVPDHPTDIGAQKRVGLLWRYETQQSGPRLLVSETSQTAPDWTRIDQTMLLNLPASKDLTPLLDSLSPGAHLRFRILTEPTIAVAAGHGTRGKRTPIETVEGKHQWLQRSLKAHGLQIEGNVIQIPLQTITAKKRKVFITPTQFDGTATITDPVLARTAIKNGIGRSKAFGCGLLSVARATPM